jgi:hypothetical protein
MSSFKIITEFIEELISENGSKKFYSKWEKEFKKDFSSLMKKEFKKQEKKDFKKMDKKKKPEGAPKGVRSSYIFFCMEERPRIKDEFPEYTPKQIISELATRWQELKIDNQDEFERFQKMAEEDKKRSIKEKAEFVPPPAKNTPKKTPIEKSKSAYFFFCEKERPKIKKEGFTGRDIFVELGARWQALKNDGDRDKEYSKYVDMAEKQESNEEKAS